MLHIIRSLKSTGKAACILPHGVLFRGNAEAEIRRYLIEKHIISGIIGLPSNIFFGTGIPACLIIIDKSQAATSQGIFMIDAKDGFAKDGPKNRLREQDIRRIVDSWRAHENVSHYARLVSYEEIERNDFNLNIPRYVDTFEEEEPVDLVAVNTNLLKINEELVQQEQVLLSLINDFSESEENQALIESMRLLLRGGHDE